MCAEHKIDCFYVLKDSLNTICPACILSLKLSHENLVFIPEFLETKRKELETLFLKNHVIVGKLKQQVARVENYQESISCFLREMGCNPFESDDRKNIEELIAEVLEHQDDILEAAGSVDSTLLHETTIKQLAWQEQFQAAVDHNKVKTSEDQLNDILDQALTRNSAVLTKL